MRTNAFGSTASEAELPGFHRAMLFEADAEVHGSPRDCTRLLPDLLRLTPDGYRKPSYAVRVALAVT